VELDEHHLRETRRIVVHILLGFFEEFYENAEWEVVCVYNPHQSKSLL
jgi:hypothetical protein